MEMIKEGRKKGDVRWNASIHERQYLHDSQGQGDQTNPTNPQYCVASCLTTPYPDFLSKELVYLQYRVCVFSQHQVRLFQTRKRIAFLLCQQTAKPHSGLRSSHNRTTLIDNQTEKELPTEQKPDPLEPTAMVF